MPFIMLMHMIPRYFPEAAAAVRLMMIVRMGGLRGSIVRMLGMRNRRVQRVRKIRPDIRFFRTVIRISPTFAFQMERRCRQQFFELRSATLRTILQRGSTQFLQHIKTVATGFASIIKYRHGNYCF